MNKMKVGIFGGSFNPIHNDHVDMMKYLAKHKIVDEVWIMPCKSHPLNKKVEDESYRVDMINLAIAGLERVQFCDIELTKQGTSYTYQTLRELRKLYPFDFSLIVGLDIINQLPQWYGYDILKKEAKFIVFHRGGYDKIDGGVNIENNFYFNGKDISSTAIRQRVKNKESIEDLVPKAVEQYIIQNQLYR
jgi:nicotinate-nucleotide adenylyltransferase